MRLFNIRGESGRSLSKERIWLSNFKNLCVVAQKKKK